MRKNWLVGSLALAVLACSCKDRAVSNSAGADDEATASARHAVSDVQVPAPTSLCEAARDGDMHAVKEILKDKDQRKSLCPDELGENAQLNALMAASVFGELEVAQLLVEEGFDPLEPDDTGRSAYVWAASGNHPEVVDYFWKEGTRPRPDDRFIGAVLYSAGLWGRQGILDYYLAASADLDARHYGYTALKGAVQGGHLDVVKWLVHNGASTEGALELAHTFGHEKVANFLRSAAAKPIGSTATGDP